MTPSDNFPLCRPSSLWLLSGKQWDIEKEKREISGSDFIKDCSCCQSEQIWNKSFHTKMAPSLPLSMSHKLCDGPGVKWSGIDFTQRAARRRASWDIWRACPLISSTALLLLFIPLHPSPHQTPTPQKNDYSYISFPPTPSILSAIGRGVVMATPTPPPCTSEPGAGGWSRMQLQSLVPLGEHLRFLAVSWATVGAAALELIWWLFLPAAADLLHHAVLPPTNTRRPTTEWSHTASTDAFRGPTVNNGQTDTAVCRAYF